jgi:hypothetical protein
MIDVAMGQQYFDQSPGPCRVTELSSGRLPEPFVDFGERTRGASRLKSSGPSQGTGLLVQHFEVMVETKPFGSFADGSLMTGHHPSPFTGFDVLGTQIDIDAPPDKAGRD